MNTPKTTEAPVHAGPVHAVREDDVVRLPWAAPVLGVYDAANRTLGSSDQSSDGYINTHS